MVQTVNGAYQWTGTFDKEYERAQYRLVMIVMGVICGAIMVGGLIMCLAQGSTEMLPFVVLPALAGIGIALLVCLLADRFGGGTRSYVMTDQYIRMGYGKSAAYFYFSGAKNLVLTKTYIEPAKGIGSFRIYVPAEDMDFVKGFVLGHVPKTCVIDDRSYIS